MRVWTSDLDGTNARLASNPESDYHEKIKAPIEQKVPSWSPDGKWIAHWEGVEMIHMSKFTGKNDPQRDQMIASTFHVWVVSRDGKKGRNSAKVMILRGLQTGTSLGPFLTQKRWTKSYD